MFPSWIPKQITVRKDIQTAEDTQSFIETGTRAGCRRTPAGHAPRHAESPDPAPPCGAGYAKLLHEVAAVGKIPALRAFTHHLNDAPDAVILRSGTYLHFLKTFFRGVPLDDTPSLLHSAVWWSKFIVPGSPSPRRSGAVPLAAFRRVPGGLPVPLRLPASDGYVGFWVVEQKRRSSPTTT